MESWLNLTVAGYELSAMWHAMSSGNFPVRNHKLFKDLSCSGLPSTTALQPSNEVGLPVNRETIKQTLLSIPSMEVKITPFENLLI